MVNSCIRRFLELSKARGFQNRKTTWPADAHVHLYCYEHGYGTLSDPPVLLWAWQNGKFHKRGQSGFDFAAVNSHSKVINANRMRLHMLAYKLFNWLRCLVLPVNMRKQQLTVQFE